MYIANNKLNNKKLQAFGAYDFINIDRCGNLIWLSIVYIGCFMDRCNLGLTNLLVIPVVWVGWGLLRN